MSAAPDPQRTPKLRGDLAGMAAALPAETTEGTRLRIAEVLEGKPPIATWR